MPRRRASRCDAAVIVATIRALKMNGGVGRVVAGKPLDPALLENNPEGVRRGGVNLAKQIENVRAFGVPVVVAINVFPTDTADEIAGRSREVALAAGARDAVVARHFTDGGAGAEDLARAVWAAAEEGEPGLPAALPRRHAAARQDRDHRHPDLRRRRRGLPARPPPSSLKLYEDMGFGHLPVCMAKTQYSLSPRRQAPGPAHGLPAPDPRGPPLRRRRASSPRSAATCARCPASTAAPAASASTSTPTGTSSGCSRVDRAATLRPARPAAPARSTRYSLAIIDAARPGPPGPAPVRAGRRPAPARLLRRVHRRRPPPVRAGGHPAVGAVPDVPAGQPRACATCRSSCSCSPPASLMLLAGPGLARLVGVRSPYAGPLMTGFEAGMLGYAIYGGVFGQDALYRFGIVDLGQVLFVFFVLATVLTRRATGVMPGVRDAVVAFIRTPVILAILAGVVGNARGPGRAPGLVAADVGPARDAGPARRLHDPADRRGHRVQHPAAAAGP